MHSSHTHTHVISLCNMFYVLKIAYKIFFYNLAVNVSRVGRLIITNQQCSDALEDANSPESAELSSIVVSGVSDVTA